ncbi:LytTR family transcriptional regulator [Luteibacter flocculans]|uniref:LytTR family transcriptional regulator n=1 Tax=Luteibacter flocculans TaxID=2780091 RepID=A0ABY4SWE6_9GAMM|nr:LytTR family DNA-binding domain-containing protein [Luteibacter flocculans]URL57033.1 LytTR family transcriptional regulator [Luteibacter flocculans]
MRQRTFDVLAVIGVFVAYTITIRLAMGFDLVGCLLGGAANTIPVVIFGVAVRRIVAQGLVGRPAGTQLVVHLVLCAAYTALSYLLLIVLLGLFSGAGPEGFVVRPFSLSGAAWQSLENVTTYALIAAVSYLQIQGRAQVALHREPPGDAAPIAIAAEKEIATAPDAPAAEPGARADSSLSRYFVRMGDELRPLDMDTVVSIGGADDYAEVRTQNEKHLVRVTLTEFARSLDPAKYVRVHRSWIVNTHRIARAEPAGGGRLLLHMENGQTISTSREGAKLLRYRVI